VLNASDGDDRARKRRGGRIEGHGNIRTAVRRSHSPARIRCRKQLVDRIRQVAAEARNCNSAQARAEVQSYRYRRSSVEQFQTRMRTPPMLSVQVFLPCRFPLLSGGLNPAINVKLPKKMTVVQITQRLNEKDDSGRRVASRYRWNFLSRFLRSLPQARKIDGWLRQMRSDKKDSKLPRQTLFFVQQR
jgi:hypothetical protein